MLPNTIVGTAVTGKGSVPFAIDTASGAVRTGSYVEADPMQRNMSGMEEGAVDQQVRAKLSGVKSVRIGSYQCPACGRWVDVVKSPDDWNDDRCARC